MIGGSTPVRLNADAAVCVNLVSLFVVIYRVSVENHFTSIAAVASRRAHPYFNFSS
jgi:hypothetical protein